MTIQATAPDDCIARVERYVAMRAAKPIRLMDDVIHGIHMGEEWEAELRLSDIAATIHKLREAEIKLAVAEEASDKLATAIKDVIDATCAYLPPDGISGKECISRILEATDNQEIFEVMKAYQ